LAVAPWYGGGLKGREKRTELRLWGGKEQVAKEQEKFPGTEKKKEVRSSSTSTNKREKTQAGGAAHAKRPGPLGFQGEGKRALLLVPGTGKKGKQRGSDRARIQHGKRDGEK